MPSAVPQGIGLINERREGMTSAAREIRLVGRGGQGVVTAGDLLGSAALHEGRWAQSIPTFGPERRGALSTATLRIADEEILLKCAAARPEVVLVLDPTIWHHFNVFLGIREEALLVFNTTSPPEAVDEELRSKRHGYSPAVDSYRLFTVDATGLAMEALGRPITNTAMMGAFVGATRMLTMASVEAVLTERFGAKAEANLTAARKAANGSLKQLGA